MVFAADRLVLSYGSLSEGSLTPLQLHLQSVTLTLRSWGR